MLLRTLHRIKEKEALQGNVADLLKTVSFTKYRAFSISASFSLVIYLILKNCESRNLKALSL